jgi:hypothetical protein
VLPSRGTGSFSPPDKELTGRKNERVQQSFIGEIESESKTRNFSKRNWDPEMGSPWECSCVSLFFFFWY